MISNKLTLCILKNSWIRYYLDNKTHWRLITIEMYDNKWIYEQKVTEKQKASS